MSLEKIERYLKSAAAIQTYNNHATSKRFKKLSGVSCWAVIPAAGIGSRMQTERPKQYLPLVGKTVIEHSIDALLRHPNIEGVMVALNPQDDIWDTLSFDSDKPIVTVAGGEERVDSVLNALIDLQSRIANEQWVLVHDAARPCLTTQDIDHLIRSVSEARACGGLLAMPVRDTMKRADQLSQVVKTVSRAGLWHAQTPQMFRLGELRAAIDAALKQGVAITDESSAMENQGAHPLLVECAAHNLKITHPEDLYLAACHLLQQNRK